MTRAGTPSGRASGLALSLALLSGLPAACSAIPSVQAPPRPAPASGPAQIDIVHQSVELDPFGADGTLTGLQTLTFVVTGAGDRLQFDTGALEVASAELDGQPVPALHTDDAGTGFQLPNALQVGTEHALTVAYSVDQPRDVQRSADRVYTGYFACDWMVCRQSDFADRFTMDLTLVVPDGMSTLGPGNLVDRTRQGPDRERHLWRTTEPFPAYVHAFAAGRLTRLTLPGGCPTRLEVWVPEGVTEAEGVFAETCDMLRYFEGRSGVAFPAPHYSQLFNPDRNEAQEAVSHSILGGSAVLAAREDPTEDWAVAHELAHQWWGNRITARDLTQFWLNEGVVTFMVAAWKEHRWGRDAYDREIGLARTRWEGCRERWQDVPLTFAGPWPSLGVRRCFQYSKASVFLDVLRQTMGEDAFWLGIRTYTRDNLGQSVTSADFERAMQARTPTDLHPLFESWVYGSATAPVPSA